MLSEILHSVSLDVAFILEDLFPTSNTWWTSFKNQTIPLLPDVPSCYDEDFHEKIVLKLLFSQFYHLKERCSNLPLDTKLLPTGSCKRTTEEEMKSSFFSLSIANDTVVVIPLNLVLLSF